MRNKQRGWTQMTCCGLGFMFSSVNTLFTGGTVLTSLACAWLISVRLLGTKKQQLLIIITIYFNNEAARALYGQTKGQKLAEKWVYAFVYVWAYFKTECIILFWLDLLTLWLKSVSLGWGYTTHAEFLLGKVCTSWGQSSCVTGVKTWICNCVKGVDPTQP